MINNNSISKHQRTRFQGVTNIIRFNWPFYVWALSVCLAMLAVSFWLTPAYSTWLNTFAILILASTILSLLASWYVYDASGLYNMEWLPKNIQPTYILNIHAGFDETSAMLQHTFPEAYLKVFDFYNPITHTEPSIERARKAYPAYLGTISTNTQLLPLANDSVQLIFVGMAAHEIRNEAERIQFFKELKRVISTDGKIVVVEHLRDLPNFMVYNIGCLHFYSSKKWQEVFLKAGLQISNQQKINPFVHGFELLKNGNTN